MTLKLPALREQFQSFIPRTIGFDDMFHNMDRLFKEFDRLDGKTAPTYPPYNYVKLDDQNWELHFAVAGFDKDELSVSLEDNILSISGKKETKSEDEAATYLYKGISERQFKVSFTVSDGVEVSECSLENGILNVHLFKPKVEKQVKQIEIK